MARFIKANPYLIICQLISEAIGTTTRLMNEGVKTEEIKTKGTS